MTYQPQQAFPTETILAARLLSYIPRSADIPIHELKEAINGNDPHEQQLYKYAIQLLIDEGYQKTPRSRYRQPFHQIQPYNHR